MRELLKLFFSDDILTNTKKTLIWMKVENEIIYRLLECKIILKYECIL